jgi:hypothetical protein
MEEENPEFKKSDLFTDDLLRVSDEILRVN